MQLSIRTTAFAFLAVALAFVGCDTNEPDPINPEELITQVTITFTNAADGSDTVTIVASDSDGDGAGITFSPMSASLRQGATYNATIELRDTINNEDITEEIEEESEEHLFRYTLSPSTAGAVTITDSESDYTTEDENGAGDLLVGLAFNVAVDAAASGTGTLNATLFHFDDAPKTSSTATSDEIDVDIDFPVTFATVVAP